MAPPRKSYKLFIAGMVFRTVLGLLILTMVLFLLWRVYFSDNLPKEMEHLSPNDTLSAAYAAAGDDLELFTQTQSIITRGEENYGYFSVPRFVFIPAADQVQVVFRYNNSTLKAIQKDLELAESPPKGVEIFDVSLILRRDLTPHITTDNTDDSEHVSKERFHPTAVKTDTTSLYTYFLYTFDGVDLADDTLAVYFDIYYGLDPDYSTPSMGQLRLFHADDPKLPVKLSSQDKKVLTAPAA